VSQEVSSLDGIGEGVWHVYTETSRYTIDLDNKRGLREPGKGLGNSEHSTSRLHAKDMRADGEWFTIKGIFCEVGPGMSLICEGISPADIFTLRKTTWVQRIEKVEQ
jgi:hypothetical protein